MHYISEVLKFHGGERLRKKYLKRFLGVLMFKACVTENKSSKVKNRDLHIIKYQIIA